jgi:hypothetical protein
MITTRSAGIEASRGHANRRIRRTPYGSWLPVVAAVSAVSLALAACGGGVSQDDVDKAVSEAVTQAQQQQTIQDLQEKLKKAKRDHTVHGAPTTSTGSSLLGEDCGDGVRVNENTSCPFARYVAEGYRAEGAGVIRAYSPVTNDTYAMSCESGDPAVCRGGNDAVVYIYD